MTTADGTRERPEMDTNPEDYPEVRWVVPALSFGVSVAAFGCAAGLILGSPILQILLGGLGLMLSPVGREFFMVRSRNDY